MSTDTGETAGIDAFLVPYGKDARQIALTLRRLVLELVPGAIEQVDLPAKILAYGFARTYKETVCVIMPQKHWVNLGFPRGGVMTDPAGLLTGTGKRARHVQIRDAASALLPAIRDLISQAAELARSQAR